MLKEAVSSLIFIILFSGSAIASGEDPKSISKETGPKAFKILKRKSIDPKTGLPKTLDPKFLEER